MSPRAAWRLEHLGFEAYDYVAGKMDWLSFDLPYEGEAVLASRVVDRDVATARLDERVGEVAARATRGLLVVVNEAGVVMGVAQPEDLDEADPDDPVDAAMTFGVTTVRPSEDVEALLHRMHHAGADCVVVTRSDGRLVGVLVAADAEQALGDLHADGGDAHP